MPRKRKTTAPKRPKVAVPDGNEGQDLDKDVRKDKLHVLLRDFDNEVEARIDALRIQGEQMIDKLNACFHMELCRIPANIRDMKVTDFLEAGGSIDVVAMRDAEKLVEDLAQSISVNSASKNNSGTASQLTTITEEENQAPAPSKTKPKRGRAKKGAAKDTSMGPPPTTARTMRTMRHAPQFVTPCHGAGPSAAGWETPLVTPKFDPRLPCTPAVTRDPKPGERLMSLAGSPITNSRASHMEEPECRVPLRNKTLQLTASTDLKEVMGESSLDVDNAQLSQLEALQKKIASFIKIKKQKTNRN